MVPRAHALVPRAAAGPGSLSGGCGDSEVAPAMACAARAPSCKELLTHPCRASPAGCRPRASRALARPPDLPPSSCPPLGSSFWSLTKGKRQVSRINLVVAVCPGGCWGGSRAWHGSWAVPEVLGGCTGGNQGGTETFLPPSAAFSILFSCPLTCFSLAGLRVRPKGLDFFGRSKMMLVGGCCWRFPLLIRGRLFPVPRRADQHLGVWLRLPLTFLSSI